MTRRTGWFLRMLLLGSCPFAAGAGPATRDAQLELESWLDADTKQAEAAPSRGDVDLPPPRRRGLVLEGSVGALGHLGDMQAVSPVAPWFRLQVGYELLDWLMLLGQGDVAVASTGLAHRPPEKRGFALFGLGAGARLAWQPWSAVGVYLQADAGLSSVTEDVLATYGYPDADRLRPFVGSSVGLEWFQVSPHYGLALYGGARDYFQNFERVNGRKPPLVWISGVAIRYAL